MSNSDKSGTQSDEIQLPEAPAQMRTGEQPTPSKLKYYPIAEPIFGPTLQGEGNVIGMQTMFIRFAGCDYRCTMCDSLHAVLPRLIKQHSKGMTTEEIVADLTAKAGHCKMVTFSGGNPAMWDLDDLTTALRLDRWVIAVETQGTIWRDWMYQVDYLTISPKGPGMGERFEPEVLAKFMEQVDTDTFEGEMVFKIVIFDQRDIEFAKELTVLYPGMPMFLSLGNPYPLQPQETKDWSQLNPVANLSNQLLKGMCVLFEDIRNEPLLANARFLPQLHVLLYGNKQGY